MSTLDDLRETLESHSRELPLSQPRTIGVHRRIRRIHRQRVTAGASALIAVAVVGALSVHVATRSPAQTGSEGLPEYADGGRLIGALSLDASKSTAASTTIVPSAGTLIVGVDSCAGHSTAAGKVFVEYAVNGKDVGGATCGSKDYSTMRLGLTPGQPVAVQVMLTSALGPKPGALSAEQLAALSTVRVRVGLYTPVPRSQYVFPARPAHLESLPRMNPDGDIVVAGADGPSEMNNVDLSEGLHLDSQTIAPGVVTITVAGHRLGSQSSWTYHLESEHFDWSAADLVAAGITTRTASVELIGSDFHESVHDETWQARMGVTPAAGSSASP
jgi:hypothetical protein